MFIILLPSSMDPRSCERLSLLGAEDTGLKQRIHSTERQSFASDAQKSCSPGSSLTSLAHASLFSLDYLCAFCSND